MGLEEQRVQVVRHKHIAIASKLEFGAVMLKYFQHATTHAIRNEPSPTVLRDGRDEMDSSNTLDGGMTTKHIDLVTRGVRKPTRGDPLLPMPFYRSYSYFGICRP